MGAALSSRAEWTSASEGKGKLDFSKTNEALLSDVVHYVEALCREHQREAEVIFKRSFAWTSSLSLSSFDRLKPPDYTTSDTAVVSTKQREGEPLLAITQLREGVIEVRAWTLHQLAKVLSCAGDKKLREAQLCLEANPDPVASIMGPAYADAGDHSQRSKTLLEVHQRLARAKERGDEGGAMDELDSSFRLLLLLNSLDLQLLHSSVKQLGQQMRLNASDVQNEVELLQSLCGGDGETCLKNICYTSDLVFSNGLRAPPWRQVMGDISYLLVTPLDGPDLCITASTEGYFINKGMSASGEVLYDRIGEVTPTLIALLKTKSAVFATNIAKQEFQYTGEDIRSPVPVVPEVTVDHHESDDGDHEDHEAPPPHDASPKPQTKGQRKTTDKTRRTPRTTAGRSTGNNELFVTAPQSPLSAAGSTRSKGGRDAKIKSASSVKSRASQRTAAVVEESESSSEGSEEEDQQERRPESNADLPSEYWQIQKLIKYLKGGNQTASIIALCSLMDFDLSLESSHLAIRDSGGLDLLINLMETNDVKCQVGALRILREVSINNQTRRAIVDLKGLPQLIEILKAGNRELRCLAAETIANVGHLRKARRIVRINGGLRPLVNMLEDPGRPGSPITGQRSDLEVARSAALGLWSCSRSKKNKLALLKTNAVHLLGQLLKNDSEDLLIPVVGTLQECASEPAYQSLIQSEGMIEHLVRGLKIDSIQLQMHCASAIFKCACDTGTRALVRQYGGLDPLSSLLKQTDNNELLVAATGAIWKCSKDPNNVKQLKELKTVDKLVALLNKQPEEVLVNVVGALAECAMLDSDIRQAIRKAGGVGPLVQLLTGTNQPLLINTTKAVGACALETESMAIIDNQDGVRLLWSLLKSPNPEVQACAAWAICPCIENAKDAGELVRSFVGGLELIVGLLKSTDPEVLASVCAAIAKIAQDQENLAVITDHGVVAMLSRLSDTQEDQLRRHLADAIAMCCSWRNNKVVFGQNNAVAPLVSYLCSTMTAVHRSTARALFELSKDPDNCITEHEAGVVQLLLPMVGSSDAVLQEAAAGCISNIRHLALANEKAKYK